MGVCRVEPHEPEQPIGVSAGEQVGDLPWLVCGRHRACLSDEYRVTGDRSHGADGRPEQGSELPGGFEVVTVDSYPVHIGTAGPPLRRSRDVTAMRVVDDVDGPQPGHILGP